MRRLRTTVKSGLGSVREQLLAPLLCAPLRALGVVSGLSLLAALRVDACVRSDPGRSSSYSYAAII